MSPTRIGHWLEDAGRRYCVELDIDRTVKAAWVQVTSHDKKPAMRRLKHTVTLARLKSLARPVARCPHCGSVVAA